MPDCSFNDCPSLYVCLSLFVCLWACLGDHVVSESSREAKTRSGGTESWRHSGAPCTEL